MFLAPDRYRRRGGTNESSSAGSWHRDTLAPTVLCLKLALLRVLFSRFPFGRRFIISLPHLSPVGRDENSSKVSRRAQNNSNQKQNSNGSRRCPLVSTVDQGETGPRTRFRLPQFFFRRRSMAKWRPRPIQIQFASQAK
jgi:hypothetical protein